MRSCIYTLIVILLSPSLFAEAQTDVNDQGSIEIIRDLLSVPEPVEMQRLVKRNELRVGKSEYFAKPGRFGIFKPDIKLLEGHGTVLAIRIFEGPPIIVTSNGIKRDQDTGFVVGTWTGDIRDPNSNNTYPIEWGLTTFAMDDDGNYVPPPQTSVFRGGNGEVAISLSGAGLEKNATIIQSVTGRIDLPFLNTRYIVSSLENDRDYVIIYEVDEQKTLLTFDNFDADPSSATGAESKRRSDNYLQHVEELRRRLANQED